MSEIKYPQAVQLRLTDESIRVFIVTKAPAVPEITLRDGEVLVKVSEIKRESLKED